MRKLSLCFVCFFILVLMGCGDTSGDPTAQITKLEALPADVAPGSSTVITATVVKAVGTKTDSSAEAVVTQPGWGENVTFKLLTANGGQLSTSIQKTDGNGVAMTVYTAGNNYSNDTIQATLDNGMTASIVITKTGGITGARISKLEGPTSPVAENQTAVITATVTNQDSTQPMMGEPVTFTIPTNASGACFINAANACVTGVTVNSDASGKAVAVYRAGGNNSTQDVYDTVRAALANGSTNAVVITRKTGPTGAILDLTASPTEVGDGQTSIIKATVSGGVNAGANESVTLTIPVNNSGASFINAAGASVSTITITTGSGGVASAIYRAGTIDSGTTVQDTVQGVLSNGAMNSVTITRSAGKPLSLLVAASPTSVGAGQSSIVTATLTGTNNSGVWVSFSLPLNNSGATLSASGAITDGAGKAVVIYRAGANNPTLTVDDTVQATVGSVSSAAVITRTANVTPPLSLAIAASPSSVSAGQASIVTATLTGNNNSGVWVSFSLPLNNSGATLSASGAVTDGAGRAVVIYSAGAINPTLSVSDTVSAAVGSISASAVITRTGAAP